MSRRPAKPGSSGQNSGESKSPNLEWRGSELGSSDVPQCDRFESDYFGVVKATLTRRRQESNLPTSADWLDVKGAPAFFGLPCMGVERLWAGQWATYRYGYEGIIPALGAAQNITFEIDLSLTEEPIQTHPDFANLRAKYLWNPNTQRFPEIIPGTGKGKGKIVRNPLAGVEAYLSPGAIFRKTTVSMDFPGDVYSRVGLADRPDVPPGFTLPSVGTRQWFKLGPKVTKRGNCIQIVEEWLLSGPYGINTDIYNRKALWESATGANDSGGSGGLSTGSL